MLFPAPTEVPFRSGQSRRVCCERADTDSFRLSLAIGSRQAHATCRASMLAISLSAPNSPSCYAPGICWINIYGHQSVARRLTFAVLAPPFLPELVGLPPGCLPPAGMRCGHRACHLAFLSERESRDGRPSSSSLPETRFH